MSVYQEGTVAEYCEKFILFASPLSSMTEEVIISNFIKGLKPLIRTELRLWDPECIEMAIE